MFCFVVCVLCIVCCVVCCVLYMLRVVLCVVFDGFRFLVCGLSADVCDLCVVA